MKITAIQYGKTTLGGNFVWEGGDENARYPIALLFFCVQTKDKTILVDVGCDVMHGFEVVDHVSPPLMLSRAGIAPESVTDVVVTHGHEDHAEAVHYYQNALITVHKNEAHRVKRYATKNQVLREIDKATEICNGVTVVPMMGHSQGSCVVEVETKDGTIVLCGDECYHKDCFANPAKSGGSINRQNTLAFFEKYGKDEYQKILFHDPDLVGETGYKILYEE